MSDFLNIPIVVFGAGSIGERHIGVLQKAGFTNIHVYRTRNLPLRSIDAGTVQIFTDIYDIDTIRPVAAIICTPTALHMEQALFCASRGIHVLIEKPFSDNLNNLEEFRNTVTQEGGLVKIAYMLRYHPAMKKIKSVIQSGVYGKVLSFHTHWGEYLPDWHPWEDYRTSYAAQKELGGGAALTLSHDLDIVNWWMDELPVNYASLYNRSSQLEVNVEGGADFLLRYNSGVTGHVHLNFYQKVPSRYYQIIFDEAVLEYFYFENELKIKSVKDNQFIDFYSFDRNDMFRDQTIDFMQDIHTLSFSERVSYSMNQIDSAALLVKMCEESTEIKI